MTTVQNNIQLSILIASIPSRIPAAMKKYNQLMQMVGNKNIEVLMFTDNKKRTIGAKREALKNICKGKYFMFCDDDDELLSLNEIYRATFKDVDVIDFKVKCFNDDGSSYIVTQQLGNEVEHNTKNGKYLNCKRPPFPNCAWHNKYKNISFADISYGEDWVFIERCLNKALHGANTEIFINKVLFNYNFNPNTTEASTKDNEHWKNPNKVKVKKKRYKRCIVNVSTRKNWPGQTRLEDSLMGKTNAAILFWPSEECVGAQLHKENNYSFKPLAIHQAYLAGYRQILWLDASMLVIKDLKPIFDIIEQDGYFFQNSGWLNKTWTNDRALEYFGTNEGEMLSSGVLGLDLTNELAYKFFDMWMQSMRDGIFNGSWDEHRHDQTCASIIAHKLGMKLQEANTFFVYGKEGNKYILDKTLILADGIS